MATIPAPVSSRVAALLLRRRWCRLFRAPILSEGSSRWSHLGRPRSAPPPIAASSTISESGKSFCMPSVIVAPSNSVVSVSSGMTDVAIRRTIATRCSSCSTARTGTSRNLTLSRSPSMRIQNDASVVAWTFMTSSDRGEGSERPSVARKRAHAIPIAMMPRTVASSRPDRDLMVGRPMVRAMGRRTDPHPIKYDERNVTSNNVSAGAPPTLKHRTVTAFSSLHSATLQCSEPLPYAVTWTLPLLIGWPWTWIR